MRSSAPSIAILIVSIVCVGCRTEAEGAANRHPISASSEGIVSVADLTGGNEDIVLSKKQTEWFLKDISGPKLRSMISEYPAAPIAVFKHNGRSYDMHGNAVISFIDGVEYLWTGPYLQALVSTGLPPSEAIAALEDRVDLSGVRMEAPGAYQGGGPAPLVDPKE